MRNRDSCKTERNTTDRTKTSAAEAVLIWYKRKGRFLKKPISADLVETMDWGPKRRLKLMSQ